MAEEKPVTLAKKMSAVMGAIPKLKKDGHNKFQDYDYVSEANVVEVVSPLLVEHGIMPFPSLKYHWQETRTSKDGKISTHSFVILNYRFIDTETDEETASDWLGEGQDAGDKGFYKAYTGAQKYAFMKTFLIPTGDDPEKDGEKPRNVTNVIVPADTLPENAPDQTDMYRAEIKAWLIEMSAGDKGMFSDLLEMNTEFTDKKGQLIRGKRDLKDPTFSDAWVKTTHHRVKQAHEEWKNPPAEGLDDYPT